MNIETNNEIINLCETIANESKNIVIEGELIVPDIKPDILSISNIDSDIFITKTEIREGKLYIDGTADVSAIYLAEDESASIRNLNNILNFYEKFDVNGIGENSIVDTKVNKHQIEFKVLNGRKVNVRIPVTINIIVKNNCEHSLIKEFVNNENIEIQDKEIEFLNLSCSQTQEIEISETISLSQEKLPVSEILKANIKIVNPDYKISYNKILAKADAIVNIIYMADSEMQSVETFEAVVPVMGVINFDDFSECSKVDLKFSVKSFTLRPVYHELKATSFSIESKMTVKADVYKEYKIKVISDMYDPDTNLDLEYEKLSIIKETINENEEIELLQGLMIPELADIKVLAINAVTIINNKNILDEKIAIEGNIDFEILYYDEKKKIIENKKVELPYQQVIKISKMRNNMKPEIEINIKNIEYRKIDASQLQIKINMIFKLSVTEEFLVEGVNKVTDKGCTDISIPSIVIYYVKPNDTLWKIAKKYRTTVEEIKEANMLKDDTIYPNQQLIILKRSKKVPVEIL